MRRSLRLLVVCLVLGCSSPALAQTSGLDGGGLGLDAAMVTVDVTDESDAGDASVPDAGVLADFAEAPIVEESPAAVLPPAAADPEIAAIVEERHEERVQAPTIAVADRPAVVIGTLLALLALLALAYLGGHPRVQALERKIGISQVITAGFPFIVLGLIARHPRVGLLSDTLMGDLSPLLRVGLGAIGFTAGFRFGAQLRAQPGAAVARVALATTALPFTLVALVSGTLLLLFTGQVGASALRDPVFVRDAVILGTAGAMTARTTTELFRADDHERLVARVLRLEELGGIVGLAVVAAYFRPQQEVTWQMPGTAWLMLTVGLGATLGLVCYFVFKRPQEGPEFVVLTLGAISFSAGVAGYLLLSPVVVAFVAGSCLTLLPTPHKHRIRAALRKLERPVYLVSLIAIGALWQVDDWRGWALAPVFTIARLVGKRFGVAVAAGATDLSITPQERQTLAVSPMGPLAIAIVVNAQLLYPGGSISPIVAAVIVGAILTEVVVQLASRRAPSTSRPPPAGPNQPVFSDPPEDVR